MIFANSLSYVQTTVNALLKSQDNESPSGDTVSVVSHVSSQRSINAGLEQKDEDTSYSTTLSQSVSQSSSNSFDEPNTETLNNELSSHSNLAMQSSQILRKTLRTLSDHDSFRQLPYLHSEVLGQHYGSTEVSLLPVPRIIGPIPSNNTTLDTAAVYTRGMTSTDSTLDENMQLADMIAMKYLGHGKVPMEAQHCSRQPPMSGGM